MSKQEKTRKIEGLTQKLSALKEQRDKLNAEARGWAEKRNKLNEQIKNLRAKKLELKNKRDKLNEKVKELKQLREKTKKEIREKIEEIKKIYQEIKTLSKKKPSKSLQILKKKLESIEWEIQTTPLSLQEEKELVEHVKKLETQLNVHRKLEQLTQGALELRAELKALGTKGKFYHEKLMETAKKSQEIHEKMLEKIQKAGQLKMEADNLHKSFLQTRENARSVQGEIMEILNQIILLRDKIRNEEEKEKKKSEKALRKEIEKRAKEKLKRGEKLTWEEFQIIAEKGMKAQD